MSKSPKQHPSKIKLEDLFRLKRSERPSDQFWDEFDRKLHQRILQAQAKKDPWYLPVMRRFSSFALRGAAIVAVLAVLAAFTIICFQPQKLPPPVNVPQEPLPEATSAVLKKLFQSFYRLRWLV